MIFASGSLSPVTWAEIEAFARALSEFCPVHATPDRVVTTRTEAGEITIRHQGIVADLRLVAEGPAGLQNLRDTLGHMLDLAREGLAEGLRWQAADFAGLPPPNFRLARVAHTTRISPHVQRLRLTAPDLGFMGRTGLHLRLLQPRDRKSPDWPRLSDQGRTIWPDTLHMPVYTVRAIDARAGWLDLDVYLHGKGPTCALAQSLAVGEELGLTGPGGGWLPEASHLVLGGDETALPAISRVLAAAAPQTQGQVLIELGSLEDIQDLAPPPGVAVHWLIRGKDDLGAAFADLAAKAPGAHVFFGGEKRVAQALRARISQKDAKIAGYWS